MKADQGGGGTGGIREDQGASVAALMQLCDWSTSPLGEPRSWSSPLRSIVSLIQSSTFPMFLAWGADLGFLYNDAYAPILGAKHPNAIGRPFREVWPDIWADISPLVDTALAGEATYLEDFPLTMNRHGFEEETWFTFSYSPARDDDGSVAGMFCACVETTGKVLAQREVAFEGERLAQLFEQAPSFMAVLRGAEHRFELANPSYRRLIGGREVIGRTVAEALPDAVEQGYLSVLDRVYETGQAFTSTGSKYLVQVVAGGPVLERSVDCVFQPIIDASGHVGGIFVEGSDVTERTRAETALRESELELRRLTDALPVLIAHVDADERYRFNNKAYEDWFGHSRDEISGRWIGDVIGEAAYSALKPQIDAALAGERFSAEQIVPYKDGGAREVHIEYVPRTASGGRSGGYYVLIQDIGERKRTEAQLRISEARLSTVLESVSDAFYALDRGGCITVWNAAAERYTGHAREDILGRRFWDVFPEARGTLLETHVTRILAGGQAAMFETASSTKPGRTVELRAAPQAGGGLAVSFSDVTERKRAEQALRDLNADLERQVAERAHDRGRTWQVSPDLLSVIAADGTFESTNPAWERALGWSSAELHGQALRLIHPEDLEHSLAGLERLNLGEPVFGLENRYLHKDGTYRWLSWAAVPEAGKFYCSARDVTDEKARAEALRERTAERDRLWTASKDLIVLVGNDGRYRSVNPAWTTELGHSPDVLIGALFTDFVHPDDRAPTTKYYEQLMDGQAIGEFEVRIRAADGTHRAICWKIVADGTEFFASGRDMTAERAAAVELEAAKEQLRQSQKLEAIGQLTGGVAHDFNNLLTVIRGSVELLQRPSLTDERRARYIQAIADTAARATKLTGQLLAFARRQALQPETFDVSDSVLAVSEMVATLTGSRIQIETVSPEERCFINADPNQFDTALVNMAVNARDAMQGEGSLTFTVSPVSRMPIIRGHPAVDGAFVAVSIKDTGSGISADQLDTIFEPFFTTKGVGQGTGLGLSQVHGFVKQSGGDIVVQSEPGRGSTFTLYLPRIDAVPGPSDRTTAQESLVDGQGACVLVVEDNEDVGEFASQILRELGYRTLLASDGEAALAELEKDPRRFDVVFSDVVMPGMSGIELGQEIRRLYGDIPVLLTSGYSHVLAQNGTYGFELLHKPYSIEQLSHFLRKAAGWRGRQRSTKRS